ESVWRREVLPLGVSVVALAVVFYPSALGLTWFDLYATGYQPMVLSAFVLFIALGALWTKRYLLSVALAFSLAFWVQGLLDSDNLWDYLMDPLLTLYALIIVGKWTCARLCQSTSHRKA
ncbi:MAG: hypothetical protein OEZ23_08240, partial [Gammaproteobacteria bacterium]|nr:hypothetical protein [Gammaproteobacteria bacterium]